MAEVWFVGRLSTTSLASIALVFPLLILTQMMSGGAMGGAVAASIARALAANDIKKAEQLMWHAIFLAVSGAMTLRVVYLVFVRIILTMLGGSGEVLAQAKTYCLIVLFYFQVASFFGWSA
ncbi:MAG: Na+-driven multidrug efflux pump [Candidatus Azotimanducaceae bacterium]|jgi:Na+-driven multidrug efflux pump